MRFAGVVPGTSPALPLVAASGTVVVVKRLLQLVELQRQQVQAYSGCGCISNIIGGSSSSIAVVVVVVGIIFLNYSSCSKLIQVVH